MSKKGIFSFVMQFILTMAMAYAVVSVFNYFFVKQDDHTEQARTVRGQHCKAPETSYTERPISREIDFIDSRRSGRETLTTVKADWGSVVLTTDGAALQRFEVNRELDGKASSITTVFPAQPEEREFRCFLVALNRPTPYFYHLEDKQEADDVVRVTYAASFEGGTLKKTFVIHKHVYQIDVALAVTMHSEQAVQVRMLYPAPLMIDLCGQDVITGFVLEEGKVKRFNQKDIHAGDYWRNPTLFGASDRYFVNSLVADKENMVDRAYFWQSQEQQLFCCVESQEIVDAADWTWSFYFGPKDTDDVKPVDARLEELVEYSGWLGPISMLMLKFLKFLYSYFRNYGVAIIILTIIMRLLMLPLTFGGEKQRKKREEMDKKLKYIQQKYKHDPQRMQQERLELVRKYGLGGGAGCLMPFVQLPIFIALNRLLSTSIELYKAPFVPGWITDLSAPDPYYILPMFFAFSMILTSFQMEKSQRTPLLVMGVGGAMFFSSFASGLVLFFSVSAFLGVVLTYMTKKLGWA